MHIKEDDEEEETKINVAIYENSTHYEHENIAAHTKITFLKNTTRAPFTQLD